MPLNVIVVGAGLGGLGAAIALNRQGHNVTVRTFLAIDEQSSNKMATRSLRSLPF